MVWQLLTWPLDSTIWLAEQIEERALAELDQKENLQKQLTALQIKFDLGEIEEEDFITQEDEILQKLAAQMDADMDAESE
ncbi:gas vesicle protein GvpG [Pseudanabaena sp. PCC 6802]|uniref:gas vesicle protein GvpG n=1 Tax=Pseudanabaena sp. PCC 6802 TaxID=118173 RepID=UPI000349E990|nr:gas vesicle protein GvpG [Pseudanabaena sp. PCC 6802]